VYFESGKQYFQQGKFPQASIQFQNALQIDKNFAPAHYQLAQCFLQQGLWGNAYRELSLATDLEPTDFRAQLDLANLLFGSKQFQDARAHAEAVLKGAPSQVTAQILLANSDAELGDMQTALREARQAMEMDPEKPTTYLPLGLLQEKNRQSAAAEQSLRKAISLDAAFMPSWLEMASFASAKTDGLRLRLEYLAALNMAPDNTIPRAALASSYLSWGKTEQAEKVLQQAKEAKPDDPNWYRLLGDSYLAIHEQEKALSE
jgi:Tfp pilus assembly protein PilF